jgi:hypothetical protein
MRAAREKAKVPRTLRMRRMMQKFRRKSFHDSIDIVHAKLALIDKETIGWRFGFEECDRAFDSPNPADERPDQQGDNAEMRNQKRKMMFAPGPTGKRRDCQVRAEKN